MQSAVLIAGDPLYGLNERRSAAQAGGRCGGEEGGKGVQQGDEGVQQGEEGVQEGEEGVVDTER